MDIYSPNRRTNKTIAIVLLGLIFANQTGLLKAVGLNLSTLDFFGIKVLDVLLSVGVLWVIYGLWKYKIGA